MEVTKGSTDSIPIMPHNSNRKRLHNNDHVEKNVTDEKKPCLQEQEENNSQQLQPKDTQHVASITATSAEMEDITSKTNAIQPQPHHSLDSLPSLDTTTLYVGNIPSQVADVHLHKLFHSYGGEVRRAFQCRHPTTGQPRGYGFVELGSISSAQIAMQNIDGKTLLGKKLIVRPARHKSTGTAADPDGASGLPNALSGNKTDLKREQTALEAKIAAVKRAMEEKQKR